MIRNGNWSYLVVPEVMSDPLLGRYRTYGIEVLQREATDWQPVAFIHDVATTAEVVEELVCLFNQYQLSPTHLRDVLDDMLP